MRLQDYADCSTAQLRQLDLQLINEINKLAPGTLVSFGDFASEGAACHPYAQSPAVAALKKAVTDRGKTMVVNSAYRTIAQQMVLYRHHRLGRCGIVAAAKPGLSNHNGGLAIDIEDAAGWKPFLAKQGWRWIGAFDPMHFDFKGSGCRDVRMLSIKAFQRLWNANNTNKLKEDGNWGPQTEAALLQTPIQGWEKLSEQDEPDTISEKTVPDHPVLKFGDTGEEVKVLQRVLNKQGFAISPDGNFGQITLLAVKSFQGSKGLASDGIVGELTREALGI